MSEQILGGILTGIQPPTKEAWCLFAGPINEDAAHRFFNSFASAVQGGFTHIHCLFQTSGGTIGDGIALYNLFKSLPIKVSLYNVGSICSIGVVAYLGAGRRVANAHSAFMVHRTMSPPLPATVERLTAMTQSVLLDDRRVEEILRSHTSMAEQHWETHKVADLWLSADEAKQVGIATEIGDFAITPGQALFYV